MYIGLNLLPFELKTGTPVSPSLETFIPILVFPCLFVYELGARTGYHPQEFFLTTGAGQTDGQDA